MNVNKTNPRPFGQRWTIADAEPLRPTFHEFLEKARSATHSAVAQVDLVEQPSEDLVPFAEAIPGNHPNGRTDPHLKRCLGLLSFNVSAADLTALKKKLTEMRIDFGSVVLEYIPWEDTLFGGAEWL